MRPPLQVFVNGPLHLEKLNVDFRCMNKGYFRSYEQENKDLYNILKINSLISLLTTANKVTQPHRFLKYEE